MSATTIAVPSETDVVKWNENDVQQFLTANQTAFNLKDGDIATMKKQDIDSLALLALNRGILLAHFGFTYGSASKMENLIENLKSTQAPDPEVLEWSKIIPSTEIYGYTQPKGFPSILPMKLGSFWNCSNVVSGLHEYFQVGTTVLTPGTRTAVIQNKDMTRLTQAWLEFLKNSNDHFSYVFWINATSKATLNSTFRALVDPEDIEKLQIDNDATLVKAVLQKIGGLVQNRLLVFENASDAALVKSHSPHVKKGSIIVTTKDPLLCIL